MDVIEAEYALVPVQQNFNPLIEVVVSSVSDTTGRMYKSVLNHYLYWVDTYFDRSLSHSSNLDRYLRYCEGAKNKHGKPRYTARTIKKNLSAIKKLYFIALREHVIAPEEYEAVMKVTGPAVRGKKHGKWIDGKAMNELFNMPNDTLMGKRDRAIIGLLIGSGLRRVEITRLTWDQIEDGKIIDLLGKGNKERTVPITSFAQDALQELYNALEEVDSLSDHVFTGFNRYGPLHDTLSVQGLHKIMKKYLKDKKLKIHDLRKSFAKWMLENGATLKDIQQLLGHSSLAVTQIYLEDTVDYKEMANIADGMVTS